MGVGGPTKAFDGAGLEGPTNPSCDSGRGGPTIGGDAESVGVAGCVRAFLAAGLAGTCGFSRGFGSALISGGGSGATALGKGVWTGSDGGVSEVTSARFGGLGRTSVIDIAIRLGCPERGSS